VIGGVTVQETAVPKPLAVTITGLLGQYRRDFSSNLICPRNERHAVTRGRQGLGKRQRPVRIAMKRRDVTRRRGHLPLDLGWCDFPLDSNGARVHILPPAQGIHNDGHREHTHHAPSESPPPRAGVRFRLLPLFPFSPTFSSHRDFTPLTPVPEPV
jgi:hypothetical protein